MDRSGVFRLAALSVAGLALAACEAPMNDGRMFQRWAEAVAEVPVEGGSGAPAQARDAGGQTARGVTLTAEAAGLRAPIRIAVVDPLEMPNSRDLGLRAAFAAASAVTGGDQPPRLRSASTATAPVRAAASGAVYAAQLASFRSRADAEAAWAKLKARHGGLLNGVSPRFEPVDLGAKGTWVRLKAGPLSSRDEAARICRAAGVDDAWCAKASLSS